MKDPRKIVQFFFHLASFFFLFLLIDLKFNLPILLTIIFSFTVNIFSYLFFLRKKEIPNHSITLNGYILSYTILFLSLLTAVLVTIFDIIQKGVIPNISFWIYFLVNLIYSIPLLYFSHKSRLYEKNILKLKEKYFYDKLGLIFILLFCILLFIIITLHFLF